MLYNHLHARDKRQRLASASAFCPCCNGTGTPAPVKLTKLQHFVWAAIRRSPHGLTTSVIAREVYARRPNGGPMYSEVCVHSAVRRANLRLKEAGFEIALEGSGRDAVYKVRAIEPYRPVIKVIDMTASRSELAANPEPDFTQAVDHEEMIALLEQAD